MKKIICKYWLANISFGILLYIIYRMIISKSKPVDESEFEKIMLILKILLNLGYSLLYLAGILISSLSLFLNLFERIRNYFYGSLLTFLGIPLICIIYLFFIYLKLNHDSENILSTLIIVSGMYFMFTAAQFWMFRRKVSMIQHL